MKIIKTPKQTIWFDEYLLSDASEQCFDHSYWRKKGRIIGSAQGRGTTWFIALDEIDAALRHYHRGGLFGKVNRDSYFFTTWENTRSFQEYQLLHILIEAGVNVPKPIAARAVKSCFGYRADLLSQKIPNARDLVSILQDRALSKEEYQKVGAEIRKMHKAQVNHTDLNIHNILIDDEGKVWIIDFDKCNQKSGDEWKQGNLERLKRSFIKEVAKRNIHWSENDWDYLHLS
ncbi:3-deoxy-D-manno-octulosonic acid kinase [Vibrio sp. D404a]|uniref:3-deoxy-D-manno-octulosonic acid kinase n=1 Tax=unclassified Vibrio TaxID=2614977 RepID=UPI0025543F04|nr:MULTISPECIES: 3-deoxy-D-manno-octulosonic acid kinase [unclassified Vibrio]MDK9737759.1 3-deoxy-D-manno-octulosonic acid kinase [Vibrio sp. D404a]MDK9795361.1 3-deoxy-D-manno-octulosonic acid kinase [Vibrio sp. D449a]